MLARRLTTILPAMRLAEALETARIPRVAGRTGARIALVTRRPCRASLHTSAEVERIGGGQGPRPGEGSLAHHGILCLDELPEFRRHVLEVLRQPLEESLVYIQSPERHKFQRFFRLSAQAADRQPLGLRFVADPQDYTGLDHEGSTSFIVQGIMHSTDERTGP